MKIKKECQNIFQGVFLVVYRIYVEKKPDCAVEAAGVLADLRTALGM